jgi:ATP-dependent exoDNAse (exonuclease V) beta subunit
MWMKKRRTALTKVLSFPSASGDTRPSATNDAEERAKALDTRASCIVEAPAGSGKTGLLVQRYLKLLGTDAVEESEEVLAITFTNKATAELRERVLEQLQRARLEAAEGKASSFDLETRELAKAAIERSARRGWGLLERPSRLNIRSIDSVCAEIANSLPLLSGAGGPRQPVEDGEPLYRLAARRTLLQLGGDDAALHAALCTVLLHRDGSLADCETLLAGMLRTREQWGELVPLAPKAADDELDRDVRVKLERSLESVVCAGLSRALRALPAGVLEELTSLAARMGFEPGYGDQASPIALCAGKHDPPEAVAEHLEHWVALIGLVLKPKEKDAAKAWRASFSSNHIGFQMPKADAARLKELVQSIQSDEVCDALRGVLTLPPAKYPDDQWEVAKALFVVLRRALAELRLLFAERGECDFTEVALSAREALHSDEDSSDLALSAGGTLRHMLVDEMQDTSSGQYELVDLLTQSWDGHTQTLFLVGDPKQSIYLFRQARVERFLRTMKERQLGEIGLESLQLTSNFRSQAELVENFNEIFDRLFPRPDDRRLLGSEGVDVPFVEAQAVRERTDDGGVVWHPALLAKEDSRSDYAAEEAREIRRIIEERLAMPLPEGRDGPSERKPWRIAVLVRAKKHLSAVIEEFKKDDGNGPLRYRAIDLDSLDELPEVLDALALTRALLHPSDRIAWLAVLHAPWCGMGLADLLALTGEGEEADPVATVAHLVRARRALVSALGQRLLDRAWPVLETAVATLGRTSLATHVERTWRSLGGDAALSAESRKNVQRYLGVLREVEREGDRVDLSVLKGRLNKLYAEPASGSIEGGQLPVELLTIHKAKGLEWDLVLVPGLERGGGQSHSVLLNWLEFDGASDGEVPASVVLAPIGQKGTEKDKLSSWLTGIRAKREAAEHKRVFYVAATRAREELHLFGAATLSAKGGVAQPRYDSLLRACWPAAEEHFAGLLAGAAPQTDQSLDQLLIRSLNESEDEELALAASGGIVEVDASVRSAPMIQRLPLSFDPAERFRVAKEHTLPYPAASALRQTATFERPEGSFAVRAFGNVVHRYLQVLAAKMEGGAGCDDLLAELPSWEPRLMASLRGEGLPPALAAREAGRAGQALVRALGDPVGRWILSPHASAASERALTMASLDARSLRVDRTFVAGDAPMSAGEGCIWIVDFKTSEQGSRSDAVFEATEMEKYRAQLEAYAALRRSLPDGGLTIRLGLFYPLVPRLIHWLSVAPVDAAGS